MKIEIFYEYPVWFLPLCLLLGLLIAGVLYFKTDLVDSPELKHKRWKKVLAVSRFVLISIIAWLLMAPFLKSKQIEEEPPLLLFLQDNSLSVKHALDGDELNQYSKSISDLENDLGDQYTFVKHLFSKDLQTYSEIDFSGKLTNISGSLEEGIETYKSRNLAAIILASDGIYNNGINPLYKPQVLNYPVYALALGDTTPKQDLIVESIQYNKIVYLNDRFKINAVLKNQALSGRTKVFLQKISGNNTETLQEKEIDLKKDKIYFEKEFVLSATEAGVQHYRIKVEALPNEFTTENNTKDFFINALDSRQKILVLAHSPHPDISAIKSAAEQNKNYEIAVNIYKPGSKIELKSYSSVILHQLPSRESGSKIVEQIADLSIPTWHIIGTQSDFNSFNQIQNCIKITPGSSSWNDVTASVEENFQLFSISEKSRQLIPKLPPLKAVYGKYKTSPTTNNLLLQQIGRVETEYPLWSFQNANGQKSAVTAADGLWRWRLYEYLENGSHEVFNELVNKTLQYLAVKDDKRKFRIIQDKDIFSDNEIIRLEAELYNQTYELVNDPDVNIIVKDAEGKEYPYIFKRTQNAYELDIPGLSEGNYSYTASTQWAGNDYTYSGKFSIQPTQLESFQTEANHQMLYRLAQESGGQFFQENQWASLLDAIQNNQSIKPTTYELVKNQSVLNYKWLFFLLVLLLSFEWGVRKYLGGY